VILTLPEPFKRNIVATYSDEGKRWLAELPEQVASHLLKWRLKPRGEFQNLSFNFVMPVVREDQTHAVLKLGPHFKGRIREAKALDIYQGQGAVQLLAFDSLSGAALIEHAEPGVDLKAFALEGNEQEATFVAAQVMRELLAAKNTTSRLPADLTSILTWGLGFEKYLREDRHRFVIPKAAVLRAQNLFLKLGSTPMRETVLHGDLHHSNILRATRQPWLAIDPKGLYGDAAFEVGAFVRNPMPELLHTPNLEKILRERIEIFSEVLGAGFEHKRLWGWSFSQCVLAAIWTANDIPEESANWLALARLIERIEE
jgi:streptomycin 6-kinase